MRTDFKYTLFLVVLLSLYCCNQNKEVLDSVEEERQKIEMVTNYGTMVIELYNETPLHRDNFINLSKHKAFDSLLFHRVINTFMIQGGDPDSRNAKPNDTIGEGDAPYVVNAEFNSELFHKKGVLAAARDDHPLRSSSAMQFYIVQGKVFNDSLLDRAQIRINKNLAREHYRTDITKKTLMDSLQYASKNDHMESYYALIDSIYSLAKADANFKPYVIPDKHREVYKTIGGTPHLDQNYTVFGELVKGIDVVDAIASVETSPLDRPKTDVVIISVRVLE
ncbi:putative peptidyl-prolyl cis-trans isomerase [Flavobacteriales bacterium ALC-1]|nr:putative peptidyl-prolyl cis-trans isomerase [Flavobacteriales bacterium ALC-1]